jgi:UDP-N-acetylglucosamine--N-acetylmuramyl-(pentapeptide) pyrophosphoryl-undecaprenol N-acetylglucosamine transferase
VTEDQLDGSDGLVSEIERLRHDEAARVALSTAAHARGEIHRSGALAELIEQVAVASSEK